MLVLTAKLRMKKMVFLDLVFFLLFLTSFTACSDAVHGGFSQCMAAHSNASRNLYPQGSPSYSTLLESAEQNPRWLKSAYLKPVFIITPDSAAEIQATIICSRRHGLRLRVKSGGHDYEGLSFLCDAPFVLLDLISFKSISIDLEDETAWIQSGATLGEVYYSIAKKSQVHGFPAGLCPSVGVGGHFSGGGLGTMTRKYGLAADNVVDASLVDVNGKILDRKAMGEDLFWAIRGGGGATFGVIVAWKVKLVRVPRIVTGFTIHKNLNEEGRKLVHRWQYIADKLPEELFIRVIIQNIDGGSKEESIQTLFNSMFLGPKEKLIPLMNRAFPELGLRDQDCKEMSWIESAMYFTGYQSGQPWEVLLDRTVQYKSKFKAKSDFADKPLPLSALEAIRDRFLGRKLAFMILDPLGGKMNEISESESPFPHRKGNLYNIQYLIKWEGDGVGASREHIHWIKELYQFMTPYVTQSPRAAYINYRDLDLGISRDGKTSFLQAKSWGEKYFKGNFERLALVKSKVDPENFFRNAQSIPPITH